MLKRKKENVSLKSSRNIKRKGNEYHFQFYKNIDIKDFQIYERAMFLYYSSPNEIDKENEIVEFTDEKYIYKNSNGLSFTLRDEYNDKIIVIKDNQIYVKSYNDSVEEIKFKNDKYKMFEEYMKNIIFSNEFYIEKENNDIMFFEYVHDINELLYFEMLTYDYYIVYNPYSSNGKYSYEISSIDYFLMKYLKEDIKLNPINNLDLEIGKVLSYTEEYLSK